uniref:Uncharacterized protein n=1 Tax=Prolemur simus TaxID=1328070 RepID=A0A8C8YS70_PROSS
MKREPQNLSSEQVLKPRGSQLAKQDQTLRLGTGLQAPGCGVRGWQKVEEEVGAGHQAGKPWMWAALREQHKARTPAPHTRIPT